MPRQVNKLAESGGAVAATDPVRLTAALRRDFASLPSSGDRAWSRVPAVRLIDCVLSLRRHDDRPLAPTLDGFERRFPAVESVQQLRALIGSYKSPALFAKDALDSSDPARAQMLKALVEFLIRAALGTPGPDQELLRSWARKARPQDYLTVQIPGFNLAAFQHLRMLLGANTVVPQVQVIRYIAGVLGRPVSDVQALLLVEEAAPAAGLELRDVDPARWEAAARAPRSDAV